MLIHPWDAALDEKEWQDWLDAHDFGELAVNGPPGQGPLVQPLHFAYDHERREAVTHLARPNPLWAAVEADPRVTLSVVGDHAFIPTYWTAPEGAHPDHGTATSYYAAVQLSCLAHVVDDAREKSALLHRQLAHFQPEGRYARVAPGEAPYGRMLPGIRGLRLEVTEVRAKFKFAGNKSDGIRAGLAGHLTERSGPGDSEAAAHMLRRHPVDGGD
ncbi:FMN-binding negative transcriptional regulator [Wenjunlia tyrosinilytica]|jgi:transcriptional regulator|uniref:Transcriptional regulator n=1 Tax=Wenjunlia tyrosinilytica TaxID=1544741 RepID=A0A917ZK49_9ACTN|nr:FMN-binding negative transcriptional regulator [Wenjunlia tyrosinilytica]GGO84471.1 transcriptional regulator [Wenjunlia tyrosinilytica]